MAQSAAKTFQFVNSADGGSVVTAFLPAANLAAGRAIVACPNGGYSHLTMATEGTDWVEYFNKQGIAYFVLKYRMPNGDRTIPMSDAENAIKTVRDSAASWNINPLCHVGIMGSSGGGHLASTVSTHTRFRTQTSFHLFIRYLDERT